jgi:hypothetical protein
VASLPREPEQGADAVLGRGRATGEADYSVDIIVSATAAHLFGDFVTIDGITMPTRHRVHALTPDGVIDTSGTIVSIDVDNISFGQT